VKKKIILDRDKTYKRITKLNKIISVQF